MTASLGVVLAGGLGQLAASLPAAAGVALLTVGALYALKLHVDRRRRRRRARLVFNAVQDCPWCSPGACWDASQCGCEVPCGKPWCKAEVMSR